MVHRILTRVCGKGRVAFGVFLLQGGRWKNISKVNVQLGTCRDHSEKTWRSREGKGTKRKRKEEEGGSRTAEARSERKTTRTLSV